VHQNIEHIHDQILQLPDANSGKGLPKLQDVSDAQTSPPKPPRSPEPPGKNAVLQILSYAPISSALRAMLTHR
jgi:hypothetical protein